MPQFKIGQAVMVASGGINTAPAGRYKVVCPLPETHGIVRYRVKGDRDLFERVVEEKQMTAEVL